jgi:TolA-binding protein
MPAAAKERLTPSFAALVLIVGVGLGSAGCADMMADDSLQQDLAQLRQDVEALKVSASRGRGEAETLAQVERRTRAQADESATQTAALSARIDKLDSALDRLSARVREMSQQVEGLARQARAAAAPPVAAPPQSTPIAPTTPPAQAETPPTRLQAAPGAPQEAPKPSPEQPAPRPSIVTPPPSEAPPRRAGAQPAPAAHGPAASEMYQAANRDFSTGRYELAISGFREVVRRFPDSPLAESAQYSIGESYLSLAHGPAASARADRPTRELELAVQEFRKVIVNYPRGAKVPAALYKEAIALTELKQVALAQVRLQYILDHFPQSEEAPLAKERLAALKQ